MCCSRKCVTNRDVGLIIVLFGAVGILCASCSQDTPRARHEQHAELDQFPSNATAAEFGAKEVDGAKPKPKRKFRSTFFTTDRLGSPTAAVVTRPGDGEGDAEVVERYDYDATGNRTVTTGEDVDSAQTRERQERTDD